MTKGQSSSSGSNGENSNGCGHDLTAQTLAKFIGDSLIRGNPKMYTVEVVDHLASAIDEALKNMPNSYFCCSTKGETRRLGTGNKCNGPPCGPLEHPYVRLMSKHVDLADDEDDNTPEVKIKKQESAKKTKNDRG